MSSIRPLYATADTCPPAYTANNAQNIRPEQYTEMDGVEEGVVVMDPEHQGQGDGEDLDNEAGSFQWVRATLRVILGISGPVSLFSAMGIYLWAKYLWKWDRDNLCQYHPAVAFITSNESAFFFMNLFAWSSFVVLSPPVSRVLDSYGMKGFVICVFCGLVMGGTLCKDLFFTADPAQC